MNIYLVAPSAAMTAGPRSDVVIRPVAVSDLDAIAAVYLAAYGEPTVATFDEAAAEVASNFDGSWGVPWPEASPGAWIGDELVGVVQTVRRPSWDDDAPDCPWLIDIFVTPSRQRTGLARALIATACGVIAAAGEPSVGLTVDEDNEPAVTLYRSLGFTLCPETT